MADLKTLIRLRRFQLDEKRRGLNDLHTLRERLIAQRQQLDVEMATEAAVAAQSFEGQRAYPAYAKAARERGLSLERSIRQAEKRLEDATDELQQAFREVKTLELAQADRQRRAKEALQKKEAAMLDEVAVEGFRRKEAEESGQT